MPYIESIADAVRAEMGVLSSDFKKEIQGIKENMVSNKKIVEIEKKLEQNLVAAMETLTQKNVPDRLNREISRGASELDLVRSGLDDTMRMAFQDLREVMKTYPHIKDYRTAAYAMAITKIAQSYYDLGLAEPPETSKQ